jgi:hypothetical protein
LNLNNGYNKFNEELPWFEEEGIGGIFGDLREEIRWARTWTIAENRLLYQNCWKSQELMDDTRLPDKLL